MRCFLKGLFLPYTVGNIGCITPDEINFKFDFLENFGACGIERRVAGKTHVDMLSMDVLIR